MGVSLEKWRKLPTGLTSHFRLFHVAYDGLPTVIDLYMLHDDGLRSATADLGEGQRALLVRLHQPRGRIREASDLDHRPGAGVRVAARPLLQ